MPGSRARSIASLASLIALALTVCPERARAFERQHHAGVDLGLTLLSASDAPSINLSEGVGLHYTYGLTDAFNLMVEGSASFYSWKSAISTDPNKPTPPTLPGMIAGLGVGVGYVLDVLRWVPYGGLLIGGDYLSGGNLDKSFFAPDAQLALGVDYQISRAWAVGVAYRQHMLLTKASTYPSYSFFALRAEYVWGW
jgi:hypothetical protein